VLNPAVADGLLLSNPVDGVKAPTVRPRRQMFLSADELRMLAKAAGGYEALILFLGWSGLRFGEAAAFGPAGGSDLIPEASCRRR
jgi:hypothetical protein